MTTENTIQILTFQPQFAEAFKDLNVEWISTFFEMETSDYTVLEQPQEYIIDKGGEIFIAFDSELNKVIGVCAVMKSDQKGLDYEMAKMAVSPLAQGKGAGFLLGKAAIDWAKNKSADNIFLVSNTKLDSAMRLYDRLGFKKVDWIASPYERTNIAMIIEF
ncbi:GNAT family N-acetyltransferase [Soonwooa sp.]|uniref:GNAT family N-acetyltransferase n=1 Tax=Soonwooa sp. TaxID=1938592 RepID=UPI00262375B8|nr:GNAT family N-acetyltransferase [Soonwooa sp.]